MLCCSPYGLIITALKKCSLPSRPASLPGCIFETKFLHQCDTEDMVFAAFPVLDESWKHQSVCSIFIDLANLQIRSRHEISVHSTTIDCPPWVRNRWHKDEWDMASDLKECAFCRHISSEPQYRSVLWGRKKERSDAQSGMEGESTEDVNPSRRRLQGTRSWRMNSVSNAKKMEKLSHTVSLMKLKLNKALSESLLPPELFQF